MEELPHIPCDIVPNILSRLSIESLIRFKSVCKSWCNLINDDPSFAELHLRRSKSQPRIILWDKERSIKSQLLLLDEDKKRRNIWKARKISIEKNTLYNLHIIGSCNGLVCKVSDFSHRICISNPITKKYLVLPTGAQKHNDSSIFGFGVDSTGNNYKVIQIFGKGNFWKGEIITLGETSWRKLKILDHQLDYSSEKIKGMLYMDGALYCIVTDITNLHPVFLVFDIHEEKFRGIEFPPSMRNFDSLGLAVINDSLMIYQNNALFSVRLMKIEKNKSMYQYDHVHRDVPWSNLYGFFSLVGMLNNNNNNLLFQVDELNKSSSHLLVYCVEKKKLSQVCFSGNTPRWFETQTFVPSLISPILVACDKAKKDDCRSEFRGLDLQVVGYSSLLEYMDHWLHLYHLSKWRWNVP